MPVTTLTVHDQTASGKTTNSVTLEFPTERTTVRELIRGRVYQEVQDYNRRRDQEGSTPYNGLVTPRDEERALNASPTKSRRSPRREIDWKQQFDVACDAFGRNGFFILVDDRQVENLDEEIELTRGTQVSFVKLTPLVGG